MATVFKGVGTKLAKLPGIQPELDTAAAAILARAQSHASSRSDSGAYMSSLGVGVVAGKKGVKDREVYSDDPGAIPIEFGHISAAEKWVPGQRILLRALYG